MNRAIFASLSDTPWLYDHSVRVALVRLGLCASKQARPDLAVLQTPALRARLFCSILSDALTEVGFTPGEFHSAEKFQFAGTEFPFALEVSLKGKKPAPWIIEPQLAAWFFERNLQSAPLTSLLKEIEGENSWLRHELSVRVEAHADSGNRALRLELIEARNRLHEANRAYNALRLEYEDLYKLWEKTDAARRELGNRSNECAPQAGVEGDIAP